MIRRAPIAHIPAMAVIKVAARCNLYCTYCHWFRDTNVETKPAVMSTVVEGAMFARLHDYIAGFGLREFTLCLHGGEPLLFSERRLTEFCERAKRLGSATGAAVDVVMTTNAVLADARRAVALKRLGIEVTVSLDGPKAFNDAQRVDRKGRGSYDAVIEGVRQLRSAGINPTLLSVINPDADPAELLALFVDELGFRAVDFLLPDLTREDHAAGKWRSVSPFLCRLFDIWYDDHARRGVRIRLFEAMIAALLGKRTGLQGVGFSPMCVLCINSDGGLENHDALRISGARAVDTGLDVLTSPIEALFTNKIWRAPYDASLRPPDGCSGCELRHACRGGDVIHRYAAGRYALPSAYCDDYQQIYPHIWARVLPDLAPIQKEFR